MEENKNQEIENLALALFERKSGLNFRKNLTVEEKNELITKIPEFDLYRDEALKILNKKYEKKKNVTSIKKYPIIQVPANGYPTWIGGARTWCFVYSKYHGNFILEGFRHEVEKFLKNNYTHYFCYYSMWSDGQSRGTWHFWKDNIGIFTPSRVYKSWKYIVRPYTGGYRNTSVDESKTKELKFKRLPNRWIPEFDKF